MKDKKYIITSNPVVIRQAVVYAKNEKDAWDLYWGKNSKKGKIEFDSIGDCEYSDVDDFVEPEIEVVNETIHNRSQSRVRATASDHCS